MTPPTMLPPEYELDITGRRMVQQFSTLLPQVHLTLISILQGLALVVLFTNTKPPAGFSLEDIATALYVHHWYVPHLVSLLIVVTAWIEYVSGVLYLHWPMRTAWITLQFLVVVPEVAAFSSVDSIGPWTLWVGVVALFGAVITASNRVVVSKTLYRPEHWRLINSQFGNLHYRALAIILPILGWLRATDSAFFSTSVTFPVIEVTIQLANLFDFVMPIVVLCVAIVNLRIDDRFYERIVEAILSDDHSRYAMRSGIIGHRTSDSTSPSVSDEVSSEEIEDEKLAASEGVIQASTHGHTQA